MFAVNLKFKVFAPDDQPARNAGKPWIEVEGFGSRVDLVPGDKLAITWSEDGSGLFVTTPDGQNFRWSV